MENVTPKSGASTNLRIRYTQRYRAADEAFYAERLRSIGLGPGCALVVVTTSGTLAPDVRSLLGSRPGFARINGAVAQESQKANRHVDRKGVL